MKKTTIIFIFFLFAMLAKAQISFKTIVPQLPIIEGESFQVQYTIEDGDKTMNVKPPVFNNFRLVAGPNTYVGNVSNVNGIKPLINAVYTLEALRPGRFSIPGASIYVNGRIFRSNDVFVQVISKSEANSNKYYPDNISGRNPSDYFLRPGENPYGKIRQNLFVKVMLDKKICFVGEPVLATFKLYSRLESKSDIIKNPGLYGFTVYDMVNLGDKELETEKVNGKLFDVHTIRKVQLYPLQAGVFSVDAMQIKNTVVFSRSAVNKKTEQEIEEGILGNSDNEMQEEGTEVYETDISTEPVTITVKPLPVKNQPAVFSGAIGRFTITSTLLKNNLSKNEEGVLEIIISGKGNFIQLSAPVIQWPAGIEAFDPMVRDSLDKTTIPLKGSRTFRFPFVCTRPGTYQIPGVNFSFFDADSNNYKTIITKYNEAIVTNEDKPSLVEEVQKTSIAEKSEKPARTAGIIVVSLVLLILLYWIVRKKEPEKPPQQTLTTAQLTLEKLLEPAYEVVQHEGCLFYSTLYDIIWKFAAVQFNLYGSEMNKETLAVKLEEAGIESDISGKLLLLLKECEAAMFTTASLINDRHSMLSETKKVFEDIRTALL